MSGSMPDSQHKDSNNNLSNHNLNYNNNNNANNIINNINNLNNHHNNMLESKVIRAPIQNNRNDQEQLNLSKKAELILNQINQEK